MTVVKNLVRDLVEKRLWPVAVALIAALVAIPVVLGGGGADAGASAAVAAAPVTTTPSAGRVVALDAPTEKVVRGGHVDNPFIQHHLPKPPKAPSTQEAGGTTDAAAAGGGSAPSDSTSSAGTSLGDITPSTGTTAPTGPSTPTKTTATDHAATPGATATDTYQVDLRFGPTDGALDDRSNVARLAPLPSADTPLLVFLGVSEDAATAAFLLDAGTVVEAGGDAVCTTAGDAAADAATPAAATDGCSTITLQAGGHAYLHVAATNVTYELWVDAIHKHEAATKAKAAQAHARVARAGRAAVRALVQHNPGALDGWSFSRRLGVLHVDGGRAPVDVQASGALAGGVAAAGTP